MWRIGAHYSHASHSVLFTIHAACLAARQNRAQTLFSIILHTVLDIDPSLRFPGQLAALDVKDTMHRLGRRDGRADARGVSVTVHMERIGATHWGRDTGQFKGIYFQ